MVFVWWVNILLWLTNGSFWRLKHSRDCWSIICWCLFLLRSLSLRKGRCFPSCYLVSSQGLSMVMLIFPEISNIFWLWERLLGFCIATPSGTERASFSGQANGVWGVHAQSLLVLGYRSGEMGCCPVILRENLSSKNSIVMKWGFQNGKDNSEMKWNEIKWAPHLSGFCAIAWKKVQI